MGHSNRRNNEVRKWKFRKRKRQGIVAQNWKKGKECEVSAGKSRGPKTLPNDNLGTTSSGEALLQSMKEKDDVVKVHECPEEDNPSQPCVTSKDIQGRNLQEKNEKRFHIVTPYSEDISDTISNTTDSLSDMPSTSHLENSYLGNLYDNDIGNNENQNIENVVKENTEIDNLHTDISWEVESEATDAENTISDYETISSDEEDDLSYDDNYLEDEVIRKDFGRRVCDINAIEALGQACSLHQCENPKIEFDKEYMKNGLASHFICVCKNCNTVVHHFKNSPQTFVDSNGKEQHIINAEAVLGQLTCDGSHTKLTNSLAFMGIPAMSQHSYIKIRNQIDKKVWFLYDVEMQIAAMEEKAHAISMNHFWKNDEGELVPWIRVKVDAGWSQRSHHHHSMNANAAELVIIGCYTGKPICNIIRQKTCGECAKAEEKGEQKEEQDHAKGVCYKNVAHATSSKSFEPDMILEAFANSEKNHGVVYLEYCADGDTDIQSVLRKVHYGRDIRYIPCANHLIKSYRSGLEKIAKENARYENVYGLNPATRASIAANARCAIKHRSKQYFNAETELEKENIKKKFNKELLTGYKHKLEDHHEECDKDWCRVKHHMEAKDDPTATLVNDIDEKWNCGGKPDKDLFSGDKVKVKSRAKPPSEKEKQEMFGKIEKYSNRLVLQSSGLIENESTNIVENKYSIRSQLLSKSISTTRAGGFHTAVGMSGLRLSLGPSYSQEIYKHFTSKEPPIYIEKYLQQRTLQYKTSKRHQEKETTKKRRRVLKQMKSGIRSKSQKIRGHGDDYDDCSPQDLKNKIQNHLHRVAEDQYEDELTDKCKKTLEKVSRDHGKQAAEELQELLAPDGKTRSLVFVNQRTCEALWKSSRCKLLTSSNFSNVLSKQKKTNCCSVVEDIIYPNPKVDLLPPVIWGKDHEPQATKEIQEKSKYEVFCEFGIFQLKSHPHLGATPDGLVLDKTKPIGHQWGVLEVKCPYKDRESIPNEKSKLTSSKGTVNKHHRHYRQIISQMACVGVSWGLFAVWTPQQLHLEEINFDKSIWDTWLPRLDMFFRNAMAPEIVDRRVLRNEPVRNWCFEDGNNFHDLS